MTSTRQRIAHMDQSLSNSIDRNERPPRLAVIGCRVMEGEVEHYRAEMDHIVHVEWLEQGLHNEPDKLRTEVQQAVERVERDTDAEAIALIYGLCSRGLEGIAPKRCRVVIARAHDCITLLLGDKDRYAQYVREHPGTYWYSPGWNMHHTPPGRERYEKLYAEYIERYGEDNAEYLMQTEQHWFSTYDRATYVHLTVGATESDVDFSKQCADWLGWNFDMQQGDPQLVYDLLAGRWDEGRFAVIEPGQQIAMVSDDRVVDAQPAKEQTDHGR